MADLEKPVTFGATIERPANSLATPPALRSAPSNESNLSTQSSSNKLESDPNNPFSAFYKHPDARRSMEAAPVSSKTHLDVYERDLEAGTAPLSTATTANPKGSVDGRVKECTMWPSRQTMLEKKKASERARGCAFFKNLSRKQRLWAKFIIALLVVAAAVGLGVGISKAVGGGIWAGNGKNQEIQVGGKSG